jgi:hypothetical protein
MIKSGIKIKGEVEAILIDAKTGEILQREKGNNVITNDGINYIVRFLLPGSDEWLMNDSSYAAYIPSSIAIGTGTGAAAITDATMGTFAAARPIMGNLNDRSTTKKVVFQAEFGTDITSGTITETGVLSSTTQGLLTSSALNPGAGDTILDVGAGLSIGPVAAVMAITASTGSIDILHYGTGAGQWYFTDTTARQAIKVVSAYAAAWVFVIYSNTSNTSAGGAKLLSRYKFGSSFAKASTNILRVIWTYTFADA